VSRNPSRRLVADGQLYLYTMGWSHDLDGERIVTVTIHHADPDRARRRRGQPLRAKFVSREAEYPADTAVALPADVRATLDRGRELGWNGSRELWLLPDSGLQRPGLVLSGPTRLRDWAGGGTVHVAHFEERAPAERVAADLDLSFVPAAAGAAEAQWRDARRYLLRSRWGPRLHLYTRGVGELVAALEVLARRDPELGFSVASRPTALVGPGPDELAAADVVPPERWAERPEARRYRGPRDGDVVWTFAAADGPRVEAYQHHADAPDRLWRWASLHDAGSIERRFRRE
jgi:hypothetical protein